MDQRMYATRVCMAIAMAIAATTAVSAAEPPPGASSCTGCHAASARIDTAIPRLGGRSAADIVTQMKAFKSGQKPGTVMDRIAKGFTDAEMEAIAAWYAQQK
jgi:cytochrome subunit of sulfide dehydrogenase